MSYFGKDFNPDDLEVNENLYQQQREGLPNITWHSQVGGNHGDWGFWSTGQENFPDGPPKYGDWKEHEMRYGTNPNNPLEPVFITYRLRCVPIGVRQRWIVEAGDRKHFYPWFTRKENRVEGKATGHIQVMVILPDYPLNPFVLGLRGYTKNLSWSNDPGGSFGNSEFPLGVEQALQIQAKEADREARSKGYNGPPIPFLCAWYVDLVPAITEKSGKKVAHVIRVGSGKDISYVNPFTTDKIEFVGTNDYRFFQGKREELALEWEVEWGKESEQAMSPYEGSQDVPVKEDDEIPF